MSEDNDIASSLSEEEVILLDLTTFCKTPEVSNVFGNEHSHERVEIAFSFCQTIFAIKKNKMCSLFFKTK